MGILDKNIERKRLKQWIMLEDLELKIIEEFKSNNFKSFAEAIIQYVCIAYDIEDDSILVDLPWWEVVYAYENSKRVNSLKIAIPMMLKANRAGKPYLEKTYSWDYPGRTWYVILNRFTKNYGWSIEYIEKMDIDDAIALLQEIEINEQLDREFIYSLSEIAYPYDSNRKVGVFKPLERPVWMREYAKVLEPKKTKIRKDMMPVGLIIGHKDDNIKH